MSKESIQKYVDAKYVETDDGNALVESDGAEINELLDTDAVRNPSMSSAVIDARDTENNTPLHIATRNGHLDDVNFLLIRGANVNSRNALGQTALHLAAELGATEAVIRLPNSSANVNVLDTKYETPLQIANRKGHFDISKLLISKGANINSWNAVDQTPLHFAAELGDIEAVKSLLLSSANGDVRDKENNTPLHVATRYGKVDVVKLLLRKSVNVNSRNSLGQTALHLAAELGDIEAARSLLKSLANVNVLDTKHETPWLIANRKGHFDIRKLLLDHHANINSWKAVGQTPLHFAAELGDIEAVKSLLMSSANGDVRDMENNTPLHVATRYGKVDVVNLLLRKGVNVNSRNALGQTALHLAVEIGHFQIAQLLLENNADVHAADKSNNTPIHVAARYAYRFMLLPILSDRHNLLQMLLKHRAQLKQSWPSNGPLHHAAKCGNTEDVWLLLNSGENPDSTNSDGDAPLHLASEEGHLEVVEVLLRNGADANIRNALSETPLHFAAEFGYSEIFKALIDQGASINALNYANMTPLHLACQNGHVEVANLLISKNVYVNVCDKNTMTPLHLASHNGHARVVEILLDNHVTVDVMEQSEETPFYLASKNGHAGVVDLLLSRGVCDFVLTENNFFQTPLHDAVKGGHTKVVEVILKHSRKIYRELTNDGHQHQENARKSFEISDSDGGFFSAEVVLTEKHISLELLKDLGDDTALDFAVCSSNPEMLQLFLNGVRFEYSEDHLRTSFDNVRTEIRSDRDLSYNNEKYKEIAKALLNSNQFNVNHQNERGETPLHDMMELIGMLDDSSAENIRPTSAKRIDNDVIQLMLEKGADCNMKTSNGETPLMIASEGGCYDAIKLLFDWENKSGVKLDLDARDRYGETALIKAAERLHATVVEMLLNHKASVNLYNYYEFTALDEPNEKWYDLDYFCNGLLKREFDLVDSLELGWPIWEHKPLDPNAVDMRYVPYNTMDPHEVIRRLQKYLERSIEITQLIEEAVKLLLDDDKINVNAIDFMGNTPLDLAVMSSKRITSATIEALKNRGAIRKSLEPEDESSNEMSRIDERGRNPLHRMIISRYLDFENDQEHQVTRIRNEERLELMVSGFLVRPEKFRNLASATDDKGRTPLHYAAMTSHYNNFADGKLKNLLLKLGSKVNASDMYGKTPLHYAELTHMYDLLVKCGADENTKDNKGHTPKELRQLRKSMEGNEGGSPFRRTYPIKDVAHVLNTNHVTKLTKHRMVEAIRVSPRSLGPKGSSEEAIWKIWTQNELFSFNKRLSHLKPLVQHFIDRLANGIKEKDGRFECQPILVGSADEETQADISADFDFNFKLNKFNQLFEAFPHPLGPKGYFELRSIEDSNWRSDKGFGSFFNFENCLLTYEVNSRFKYLLEKVLRDPAFWHGEHCFDRNETNLYNGRCQSGLCKTLVLKIINPIADGKGGLLFVDISIDIVASVEVTDWWQDDPLPVVVSPARKSNGSTFVFDRPRFDPTKPNLGECSFSETYARISFALLESHTIKESSPLIKAAYIVCKKIIQEERKTTYQLKNCLLFCIEAFNARNIMETKNNDKISPKKLAFWVERIMFCFMEFSRHRVYPCYFMPSFRQKVLLKNDDYYRLLGLWSSDFTYKAVFSLYIDLFPDDASIDIPLKDMRYYIDLLDTKDIQLWKEFDREELIRKLSSRSMPTE